MKNPYLLITLILLTLPICELQDQSSRAYAQQFYRLEDLVKDQKVSIEIVDYFLNKIAYPAKEWPLKFDYEGQRETVEHELSTVILALTAVNENEPANQNILWRLGFAQSMAYNLDIPKSSEKTEKIFQDLLFLNPDHPQGNFFYGAHLAGTVTKQKESIPYLEKAISFGFDEALYMLGFVHLHLYDEAKALEYFQEYLKKYPDSEETKNFIEKIKAGKVKLIKDF